MEGSIHIGLQNGGNRAHWERIARRGTYRKRGFGCWPAGDTWIFCQTSMCRAAGMRGEKVQPRWNAGAAIPQEESTSVGVWRVTCLWRAMLVSRLRSQKARLVFGLVEHSRQ